MQTEIFYSEVPTSTEAQDLAREGLALEIIERRGLSGQTKQHNNNGNRNIFRVMTDIERHVYSTICPMRSAIQDYSMDSIPVDVLIAYDKAAESGLFDNFYVWYPKVAKIDDPVLVGVQKVVTQNSWGPSTSEVLYMIARWGNVLPSFEDCKVMACKMLKDRTMSYIAKVAAHAEIKHKTLANSDRIEDFIELPDFAEYNLK